MFFRLPLHQQRRFNRATLFQHAIRFHGVVESGPPFRRICHVPSSWSLTRPVTVAKSNSSAALIHSRDNPLTGSSNTRFSRLRVPGAGAPVHSFAGRSLQLATAPNPTSLRLTRLIGGSRGLVDTAGVAIMAVKQEENGMDQPDTLGDAEIASMDPESDDNVPIEAEELEDAITRPPPVNSSYLPLPWKGRLGYVSCLARFNLVVIVSHCNRHA